MLLFHFIGNRRILWPKSVSIEVGAWQWPIHSNKHNVFVKHFRFQYTGYFSLSRDFETPTNNVGYTKCHRTKNDQQKQIKICSKMQSHLLRYLFQCSNAVYHFRLSPITDWSTAKTTTKTKTKTKQTTSALPITTTMCGEREKRIKKDTW